MSLHTHMPPLGANETIGREAPLDQQVRKSHGCDIVTSVNSCQGVCTSKRRHLKSFNNFMIVKLD